MIIVPIQSKDHRRDLLVVILGPDNLERMRRGDPAEVKLADIRKAGKELRDPAIEICYEEPDSPVFRLLQAGDLAGALQYLGRGWEFRPDRGDHDRGPESLKDLQ